MTTKIIFPTVAQVLYIHDQMIKRFGGAFGVRDIGLVESALARPKATFGSQYLYESIFDKAAALLVTSKKPPLYGWEQKDCFGFCWTFS